MSGDWSFGFFFCSCMFLMVVLIIGSTASEADGAGVMTPLVGSYRVHKDDARFALQVACKQRGDAPCATARIHFEVCETGAVSETSFRRLVTLGRNIRFSKKTRSTSQFLIFEGKEYYLRNLKFRMQIGAPELRLVSFQRTGFFSFANFRLGFRDIEKVSDEPLAFRCEQAG